MPGSADGPTPTCRQTTPDGSGRSDGSGKPDGSGRTDGSGKPDGSGRTDGSELGGFDSRFMERAIELAARGLYVAHPNPPVGAVVARDGSIVGEGYHRGPGTPHAEVAAIEAAGRFAQGAELYVTLEPCVHQGRTPPCTDAITSSGIAAVYVGRRDPDPRVSGEGVRRLQEAGVRVVVDVAATEVMELDPAYFVHRAKGRPYVRLKTASSLDGLVAAADGSSKWITSEEARADAHLLRAASDAIAVGVGTILTDDPALTFRIEGVEARQPIRVVFDTNGRTPPHARVFDGSSPVLVLCGARGAKRLMDALGKQGLSARCLRAGEDPTFDLIDVPLITVAEMPSEAGLVSVSSALELLGAIGVVALLIEGGPRLAASFLRQAPVDELVVYLGAKTLGGGIPAALSSSATTISEARTWRIISVESVGPDLKVVARSAESEPNERGRSG